MNRNTHTTPSELPQDESPMTDEWIAYIEVADPDSQDEVTPEEIHELLHILEALEAEGAVGVGEGKRYGAQFSVFVPDSEDAIDTAPHIFRKAAAKAGLPRWPVIHFAIKTPDELERELARPTFPDLVGVTEIAQILGVSKQRVSELARTRRFPHPAVELAAGPVWLASTIDAWAKHWDRKPGRPRIDTDAS